MNDTDKASDEKVECEVCMKHIPRSEAKVDEASDYVMYFCGLDCFEKWRTDKEANDGF